MSETRIDANQASSWAQEITLKRLYDEARDQTGLLEKLAGTRAADLRVARDAAEGLTDVADAADGVSDALDDATRAARRAAREAQSRSREEAERARESDRLQRELQYERERREYSYRQSLNDLRTNLNAVSTATPASLWTSLGDRMAVLGGAMSETGGKSRLLGGSLTALSRVVAVATVAFAYYRDGFQTLTNMTEAGVLFNGSVEQMRQSVGRTGLSLQDFSRMVNQFGQVIGGVGEQSYARNIRQVQDLTRQFGRYGQSFEQQAESVTVFFDMLRSGGQIFMMTEQQRSRAAADYIAQTTALTRLTGRQRRQIEQEQSQVMMQAEVDLAIREMRARGDTQGAETMQQMVRTLTATLGPEMGLGVAAMQMGIVPRNQDLRRLMYTTGMGESVQGMVGQMRTMTPAQMTQQSEAIFRRMSEDPQLLGMLRVGATAGGSMEGAARLMSRMFQERGDRLIQAERTGEMPAMLEVMAGTRGILNEAATGFAQVTGDVQRAMGDLRATVASLTEQFNVFGLAFPALANITGGAMGITNMIYGMSQSLSGAALLAGGGLGAVLGARALGRGASGLVRGLGTPPAVPGMASSAGAARPGMGPKRGGLAGSMGAPTWASGALNGAGTGAMIGSIIPGIGTGIGAALGAALGGAYGYFGQETATPAGGPQMPDITASMILLNQSIVSGLGPEGDIVKKLDVLIQITKNESSRTRKAIGEAP